MPKIVIICVSVLCLLLILVMVVLTVTCRQPAASSLSRDCPSPHHQLRKAEEYLEISPSLAIQQRSAPTEIFSVTFCSKYFFRLEKRAAAPPDLLYPPLQHNQRGHHHHQHQVWTVPVCTSSVKSESDTNNYASLASLDRQFHLTDLDLDETEPGTHV